MESDDNDEMLHHLDYLAQYIEDESEPDRRGTSCEYFEKEIQLLFLTK